jgi:hypothetical protein
VSNDEIIEQAATVILIRHTSNPPTKSAPDNWRDIGIDLTWDDQLRLRLRPIGDDATDVEAFDRDGRRAHEVVRGYSSPDDLADRIEAIGKGAGIIAT